MQEESSSINIGFKTVLIFPFSGTREMVSRDKKFEPPLVSPCLSLWRGSSAPWKGSKMLISEACWIGWCPSENILHWLTKASKRMRVQSAEFILGLANCRWGTQETKNTLWSPPVKMYWFVLVAEIVAAYLWNHRHAQMVKHISSIASSKDFSLHTEVSSESPEGIHLLLWRPSSLLKYLSSHGVISLKDSTTL